MAAEQIPYEKMMLATPQLLAGKHRSPEREMERNNAML